MAVNPDHGNAYKAANDWVNNLPPLVVIKILARHANMGTNHHKSAFLEPFVALRSIALHSTVLVCPTVLQTQRLVLRCTGLLKYGVSSCSRLQFKHAVLHCPVALLTRQGAEGVAHKYDNQLQLRYHLCPMVPFLKAAPWRPALFTPLTKSQTGS